ncbi:MAG: LysM domain-containing protein [Acidimicrobiales bacterium]
MAAIIEPRRTSTLPPQRPALRLVPAPVATGPGTRRSAPTNVVALRPAGAIAELGLTTAHLVAAVVALVAVLLAALALGNGSTAGPSAAPSVRPSAAAAAAAADGAATITVRSGDTYWSIARRLQPTGDVRALVDQLQALNGAAVLQPGDQVVLPGQ